MTRAHHRRLFFFVLLSAGYGYVIVQLAGIGLFDYVALDYRVWLSGARVAADHGFSKIYDLTLLEQAQRAIMDGYVTGRPQVPFDVKPIGFLPVFVLPFLVLLPFSPVVGLILYTLFKVFIVSLVFWRLSRSEKHTPDWSFVALMFVSFPLAMDLFFANANFWLILCFAEALIRTRKGQGFYSGLWLAGLLTKFQVLVLFIPGLFLAKKYDALKGFLLGGLLAFGGSFLLAGFDGMRAWLNVVSGWDNTSQFYAFAMPNWRGFFSNLSGLGVGSPFVTFSAMALTACVALYMWRLPHKAKGDNLLFIWFGTYAASCVVTWHSYVHMAAPLIAPLYLLSLRKKVSENAVLAWAVLPSLLFLILHRLFGLAAAHTYPAILIFFFHLGFVLFSLRQILLHVEKPS